MKKVGMRKVEIQANGDTFEARLAENVFHHFRGMRFKRSGKMFFRFPQEHLAAIDMLFVPESLNLYFVDSEREVVESRKAEPVSLNPRTWRLHRPETPYKYLLESFEALELERGDEIDFEI